MLSLAPPASNPNSRKKMKQEAEQDSSGGDGDDVSVEVFAADGHVVATNHTTNHTTTGADSKGRSEPADSKGRSEADSGGRSSSRTVGFWWKRAMEQGHQSSLYNKRAPRTRP